MKNGPGTTISLTQTTGTCFCVSSRDRKTLKQLLTGVRNLLSSYKEQLQICCATVVIGAIFLGSIFIFFTQLAKYGW